LGTNLAELTGPRTSRVRERFTLRVPASDRYSRAARLRPPPQVSSL